MHRPAPGRRPPFRPRLESLESRCTPTITANFDSATGVLTISGNAADNHVTVTESATHGLYSVTATEGVGGQSTFAGVTSIAIDLKGQATVAGDTADLVGNAGANSFLSGALTITATGGLKVGFGSNFNVAGTVGITKTTITGGLTVQTGATGGLPTAQANVTLGPTTVINSGAKGTLVDLRGANTGELGVAGVLTVVAGTGGSGFTLSAATVAGGVTYSSAHAGPDDVLLSDVNVGKFVSLNGTGAATGLVVTADNCTVGTFFSVSSGGGDDTVDVNRTSVLGLGLLPKQQTFGVDLKGGTNVSNIGTIGANAANVIHGSLFHFGAGKESFNLENYTITSFVTVNAQAGNAGLTANINNANISGFLSCAAAGTGDDNVTVDTLSIGQNFAVDLGGGTNVTAITNNHYLGSYSEIDIGTDFPKFNGNTGFGDVTFAAGRLFFNVDSFVNDRIAGSGSFTATGNQNDDRIQLGPQFGNPVNAGSAVSFGKALTINLGSSTTVGDQVDVNNVSVQTDLSLAVTATTSFTLFRITNAKVGGDLTIDAGASTVNVPVGLGTTPSPNTGAVVVLGDLAITTGSLDDSIALTDVTVGGATSLTTNAGNDTIDLESSADTVPGPSQFFGAMTVSAGAGADTIHVGFDTANPARFYAAVTFDGGAGTDTLTETAPEYFGGPPTKISIP
jgi:hypothetical protein